MAVILSINNRLIDNELRNLGHEVTSKNIFQSGYYSVLELMQECPAEPDFFIQKETLGARVIFNDVHKLPCRTVFWSIDTHLNYAWQMYYALLFDVFLTPHKWFIERLPQAWQHPNRHRLAHYGHDMVFIPHEEREHKINFVGKLTGTRPQRKIIAKLLSTKYNSEIIDNISPNDMLELYSQTCIVPNESIANEVNFRLLEAASCGVCVISPNVGEDQDTLLKPNHEFLVYNSLEELEALLDFCLKKPEFCQKIGYAAWQRVQSEHTPKQRAQQLLTILDNSTSMRTNENAMDILQFCIALLNIFNDNSIKIISPPPHTYNTQAFDILVQIFNMHLNNYTEEQKNTLINELLNRSNTCILAPHVQMEHKKMLCIACGGLSIEAQDMGRSLFYLRHYKKLCNDAELLQSEFTPVQMILAWVKALKQEDKQTFVGAPYKNGCYRTAFDFVTLCRKIDPFGMEWIQALNMLEHVLHSFPTQERENIKKLLE